MQTDRTAVVIDTTQEFRLQAIRAQLKHLDAVLYTHAHADHLLGIDDLRTFTRQKPLHVYADNEALKEIRHRFNYIFQGQQYGGGIAQLVLQENSGKQESVSGETGSDRPALDGMLADMTGADGTNNPGADNPEADAADTLKIGKPFQIGDLSIQRIPIYHGKKMISGYRIGSLAYLTDCSGIPEESIELLRELDTIVIGALRYHPHPTHFSISEAVSMLVRLKPKRGLLTHMCHAVEHEELKKQLPSWIEPAYDGLVLDIPSHSS
jgi:phosphoribosyl 1,2-cyclic phosphate phosphodiesterase